MSSFDQVRKELSLVLPDLIAAYGAGSATIASEWYRDARALAGVGGAFTPMPARIPNSATAELIDWAASTGYNLDAVHTLVQGGATRRVQNFGRQTVRLSSLSDPGAEGWMRVGFGECDWCKQYLDGEVHHVEGYDFDAHDHCHCQAVPVFEGAERPAAVLPATAA